MGQVLLGSATTRHVIRASLQRSTGLQAIACARYEAQAAVSELSKTYGINVRTDP